MIEDFEKEMSNSGKTVWDSTKGGVVSVLRILVKTVYNLTLGWIVWLFKKVNSYIDKLEDKR